MISAYFLLPKQETINYSSTIIVTSQNVTRFAIGDFSHCEDRTDSGIQYVGTDCAACGPHQTSYRKTRDIPATYINTFLITQGIRMLWPQFFRSHRTGSLHTRFVPSQLPTVCSIEFETTWFERKLSLRIETCIEWPLNMLKEQSVLPDNKTIAREVNELFSMDHGTNEKWGWLLSYPGSSLSDQEKTAQKRMETRQEKERSKYFV